MRHLKLGLVLLSFLILISSCSVTKKSRRKLRKADKLIKEARIMSPSLFDTVYVTKRDTLVLTKDSLITDVSLVLDTVKVDSLIDKLVELRNKGLETKTVTRLIYEEVMPDLTYASKDSIKISVEGKERWLRFSTSIKIRDDRLVVVTKPLDNVSYTVEKAVVSIDARKIGNFWRGVLFGVLGTLIAIFLLWFFKGAISTWIKAVP